MVAKMLKRVILVPESTFSQAQLEIPTVVKKIQIIQMTLNDRIGVGLKIVKAYRTLLLMTQSSV